MYKRQLYYQSKGIPGYKAHPGGPVSFDMEVHQAIRDAVGPDYLLTYLRIPTMSATGLFSITSNNIVILILLNILMLFLGCLLKQYGPTVMLAYGGGSIKKNGVYDEVTGILNAQQAKSCAKGMLPLACRLGQVLQNALHFEVATGATRTPLETQETVSYTHLDVYKRQQHTSQRRGANRHAQLVPQ